MPPHKSVPQDLVLDLTSFRLIRAGRPVKLEKTPMEVLTLLVRKRGALVSREEIIHSIWEDGVHVDVDAGINTAIRKIRQVLGDDPVSPHYLETVVGKGYRFIGDITVLDKHALPRPSAHVSSAPSRREIRAAVLIGAGLTAILLLAMAAVHRNNVAVPEEPETRVIIAVVPLQNLSEKPGQDYFSNGLTDEILTQLGELNPERLGVVRYRPSTAMPQANWTTADKDQPPGLQYWLEGSVRHHQGAARISVRLLRAADKSTVWAESFDRNVGDVLSLQSEIAERIGRQLQIRVLGRANPKPVNPDVVEAYLHGRFEMSRVPPPDTARAYFESALAHDPACAPALAGLADFYRSRAVQKDEGSEEAWRRSEKYANQALSLDPDNADAHAAIAQIRLMHDWDWDAARDHALRALRLNPSLPEAHAVYARYLRTVGNMAEAVSHRKQALALDPFRFDLKVQLGLEYYFAHDYRSAAALARDSMTTNPEYAHDALCFDLEHMKLFDEAVAECIKALPLDGHAGWVPGYQEAYQRGGYQAAKSYLARKNLEDVLKQRQPDLWDLANAYVLVGKPKEAMRTLSKSVRFRESGLLQVRVDPDFDSIRQDPQYAELVRQIGFPTD